MTYKTDVDLRVIEQAVCEWMVDTSSGVPESIDGLLAGEGGYLPELVDGISDPWGRPYGFARMAGGRGFMVFHLGSDGQPGGSGDAADQVRLWDLVSGESALVGARGER